MAEYRQNASYNEIINEESGTTEKNAGGNTGLPFGLCKKYGISLPENATPREAWDALEKKTGLTPEQIYPMLGKSSLIQSPSTVPVKNEATQTPSDKKPPKTYGDYMKELATKDHDFFFGEGNYRKVTNQYYKFKRVLSNDDIILVTNNVKMVKDSPVLVVDNNKAVYLKNWQIKPVSNWDEGIEGYAVKLSRKYFKPYTFKNPLGEYSFDKEDTFDDLLNVAKEQEKENLPFKLKHNK